MKILTYEDIEITVLQKTEQAAKAMQLACDVTQKRTTKTESSMSKGLAKYLLKADHTSIFEHGSITFLASNISRSLLAQVTRQRMFSFTSASQHYQDYHDYPMTIRPYWTEDITVKMTYEWYLECALKGYIQLIKLGEKPEEARQILPNACTVNLVITANPRALVQFLTVRMCDRNVMEMRTFSQKLYAVCNDWLPEIFAHVGPPCIEKGTCDQGAMSCRK